MSDQRRRRSRAPANSGGTDNSGPSQPGQVADWMHRGNEGRQISEQEREEAARRRAAGGTKQSANRFWLKKGEAAEVVILDATIEQVPFFYEHHLPGSDGKWQIHEPCIKEFTDCPICAGAGQKGGEAKDSYYAMFLTVLDLRPYTDSKGNERQYSRRLLCVKNNQHPDYFRLFDQAMKDHGTIRGMNLYLERKEDGMSARIGEPVMIPETVVMYEMMTEAEMIEEFGHDEIKTEEGNTLFPENGLLQPLDYAKIFPAPDPDVIKRKYGAGGGQEEAGGAGENDWSGAAGGDSGGSSRRRRTRSAPSGGGSAPASGAAPAAGRRRGSRSVPAADEDDSAFEGD